MTETTRKQRRNRHAPKGLVWTICVYCKVKRGHTIAMDREGPMLRCSHCGTKRPVRQTPHR